MSKSWSEPAHRELTQAPDLHALHGTGPTRTRRPLYVDRLPPCNEACPAGENIQAWLAELREGNYEAAWRQIVKDNPFPAIHGRVCYHRCESACNRNEVDSTVGIHSAERFLGDMALEKGWSVEAGAPTGKRILIVGAGPSGLAAAYHLRRAGHAVVVREAGPMAGGMMHFGIPKYRLPRDILDAEIRRIEAMGVELRLNDKVEDLLTAKDGFDAVFLAIGAHLAKRVDVPAMDASRVLDAVSFLRNVELGQLGSEGAPLLGRKVAIYGGGNTAIDAARTARRLGATEALIVYRRTRDKAPAHDWEIQEAEDEGIKLHWLRTIKHATDGKLVVERMELDEKGWPRGTGEHEELEADSLVLALGQDSDTAFLKNVPSLVFEKDGSLRVNDQLMTDHAGIFAGGDMVPSERTVTVAVGHGKRAARSIDAWLRQQRFSVDPKHERADWDKLHVWFATDAPKQEESHLPGAERASSFDEVVHGFTEEEAVYEAQRCLSCGNCFECDGCYGACPERAIVKLGKGRRYRIQYDICTGCAACSEQCPCGAIEMIGEPTLAFAADGAKETR